MTALTAPEDFHDNPLWAFSLRHYARPGVKASCLALQDAHGLDVNVALACLWHEHRGGRPMSEGDIERLLATGTSSSRRSTLSCSAAQLVLVSILVLVLV